MNVVRIARVCPFCGKMTEVEVIEKDFKAWEKGSNIQSVMPYLSATTREVLISGICPKCQIYTFGIEPEGEEEEKEDINACERESLEFMGQWW